MIQFQIDEPQFISHGKGERGPGFQAEGAMLVERLKQVSIPVKVRGIVYWHKWRSTSRL